jgi:hypothetical protein
MKRLTQLAVAVAVAVLGLTFTARVAGATDANLSFTSDCDGVKVTVASHWSGGDITVYIDGPVNGGGAVKPNQSVTWRMGWNAARSLQLVVWSPNGVLNGQPPGHRFDNTFLRGDSCNMVITPPPTQVPNPCVTAPQPDQPGYDACGDCAPPGACPVTTLPSTTTTAAAAVAPTTTVAAPPTTAVRQAPPRTTVQRSRVGALPPTGNRPIALPVALGVLIVLAGLATIGTPKLFRRRS